MSQLQRTNPLNSQEVKNGGEKNCACNICTYVTKTPKGLNIHKRKVHDVLNANSRQRTYRLFTDPMTYLHNSNNSETYVQEDTPYCCALCGFRTQVKLQLLMHSVDVHRCENTQLRVRSHPSSPTIPEGSQTDPEISHNDTLPLGQFITNNFGRRKFVPLHDAYIQASPMIPTSLYRSSLPNGYSEFATLPPVSSILPNRRQPMLSGFYQSQTLPQHVGQPPVLHAMQSRMVSKRIQTKGQRKEPEKESDPEKPLIKDADEMGVRPGGSNTKKISRDESVENGPSEIIENEGYRGQSSNDTIISAVTGTESNESANQNPDGIKMAVGYADSWRYSGQQIDEADDEMNEEDEPETSIEEGNSHTMKLRQLCPELFSEKQIEPVKGFAVQTSSVRENFLEALGECRVSRTSTQENISSIVCSLCSQQLYGIKDCRQHLRMHIHYSPFKCIKCGLQCLEREEAKEHTRNCKAKQIVSIV